MIEYEEREQLEVHDIDRDGSQLVLKINYPRATNVGSCALNNDGSKAAFIVDDRKLYIVDVGKQKDTISLDRLTPIDIPSSVAIHSLIYDAKNRLYAYGDGSLWLVDSSKPEFNSLEEAQEPQGYEFQSSAISPNVDYIALLFRSRSKNEKREYHYQMVVKRKEATKDALMHL